MRITLTSQLFLNLIIILLLEVLFIINTNYQFKHVQIQSFGNILKKNLIERNSTFLTYGAWKIICVFHDILPPELKVENVKVNSSTQMEAESSTTVEKCTQVSQYFSDMEKLSDDLAKLLRLSLYPDAKLKCGDRILPVHRFVLAARSPVFNMMFRDKSSDTFDITDLNDKTLELLLKYTYTGSVQDLSNDTVVSLYEAGQKYALDSLRQACSEWMITHITEQKCVSFLDAANVCDDVPFMHAVSSFLCEHPDVFSSPSWVNFAEQQTLLAYKLIHTYAVRSPNFNKR